MTGDCDSGCRVVGHADNVKIVFADGAPFGSARCDAGNVSPEADVNRVPPESGFVSAWSAHLGPEYARLRDVVAAAFPPSRYASLELAVRLDTVAQLERMLARTGRTADLVTDLLFRVHTGTLMTLLGAAASQADTFARWATSCWAMTSDDLSGDEHARHAYNMVAYWYECQRLVADAHTIERDSLIGDLVRGQNATRAISDHEIASMCYGLLYLGHKAMTQSVANGLRALIGDHDRWQELVADPATIPTALEALPAPGWVRGDDFRASGDEYPGVNLGIPAGVCNSLTQLHTRIAVEEIVLAVPHLRLVVPAPAEPGNSHRASTPLSLWVTRVESG